MANVSTGEVGADVPATQFLSRALLPAANNAHRQVREETSTRQVGETADALIGPRPKRFVGCRQHSRPRAIWGRFPSPDSSAGVTCDWCCNPFRYWDSLSPLSCQVRGTGAARGVLGDANVAQPAPSNCGLHHRTVNPLTGVSHHSLTTTSAPTNTPTSRTEYRFQHERISLPTTFNA